MIIEIALEEEAGNEMFPDAKLNREVLGALAGNVTMCDRLKQMLSGVSNSKAF